MCVGVRGDAGRMRGETSGGWCGAGNHKVEVAVTRLIKIGLVRPSESTNADIATTICCKHFQDGCRNTDPWCLYDVVLKVKEKFLSYPTNASAGVPGRVSKLNRGSL